MDGAIDAEDSGAPDTRRPPTDTLESGLDTEGGTCDRYVTQYEGWRQLTEIDPCYTAYVATDIVKAMPAWRWSPCSNGVKGCQEFVANWRTDGISEKYKLVAPVSHGADGAPLLLSFERRFNESDPLRQGSETDVYDMRLGQPIAAMRYNVRHALAALLVGGDRTTLVAVDIVNRSFPHAQAVRGAFDSPLAFTSLTVPELSKGVAFLAANESVLALSDPEVGFVVKADLGSSKYTAVRGPPQFALDFAEGADVFAISVYGTGGWQQEYVVSPTGATLLRGEDGRAAAGFRSNGKVLVWVEGVGGTDSAHPPANLEVWMAPYTTDPATLALSARKVADLGPSGYLAGFFAGAPTLGTNTYAVDVGIGVYKVVRLSDGAVKTISDANAGPGRAIGVAVTVTDTEFWTMMMTAKTTLATALTRIELGAW